MPEPHSCHCSICPMARLTHERKGSIHTMCTMFLFLPQVLLMLPPFPPAHALPVLECYLKSPEVLPL